MTRRSTDRRMASVAISRWRAVPRLERLEQRLAPGRWFFIPAMGAALSPADTNNPPQVHPASPSPTREMQHTPRTVDHDVDSFGTQPDRGASQEQFTVSAESKASTSSQSQLAGNPLAAPLQLNLLNIWEESPLFGTSSGPAVRPVAETRPMTATAVETETPPCSTAPGFVGQRVAGTQTFAAPAQGQFIPSPRVAAPPFLDDTARAALGAETDVVQKPQIEEAYAKLPLHFEQNLGQQDAEVKFFTRAPGYTMFLTATEAVMVIPKYEDTPAPTPGEFDPLNPMAERQSRPRIADQSVLHMRWDGANPNPTIRGVNELPGISNYFIGDDPSKWVTHVPHFGQVVYEDVYPGIDLKFYDTGYRQLEYDWIVTPSADPADIRMEIDGAEGLLLDEKGGLAMQTMAGDILQPTPLTYQGIGNTRQEVASKYVIDGSLIRFEVGIYNPAHALVIDPLLLGYSTYLGGTSTELSYGIAVDAGGNAYVTGWTKSTDFPTANAYQPAIKGAYDAFVTKLSASGSLIFSTYLGGTSTEAGEFGSDIAVDGGGNIYLAGSTSSTDFPTANALQPTNAGGKDAFVTKLTASGSALDYSTYLGGTNEDYARGIALDGGGNVHIAGLTDSSNFPTANAIQPTNTGGRDAFVSKLTASGAALDYSTYLGGTNDDSGASIFVDGGGNTYVSGVTNSTDFPTSNALQPANMGGYDAFVTELTVSGSALVYSTYLGGANNEFGTSIALDGSGRACLAGATLSTDFPTSNALQPANMGGYDAFVTKLTASGLALVYSTYLGGTNDDGGAGIAVDANGKAHVTGYTSSSDFPTANPFQPMKKGDYDGFVTKFTASGSSLDYSTFLGGTEFDQGFGIAVDGNSNPYVTGWTASTDFPTKRAFQPENAGGQYDAFVTRFRLLGKVTGQAVPRQPQMLP